MELITKADQLKVKLASIKYRLRQLSTMKAFLLKHFCKTNGLQPMQEPFLLRHWDTVVRLKVAKQMLQWNADPTWTHVPVLIQLWLAYAPKVVYECGAGHYSTAVLHELAKATPQCQLTTFEPHKGFLATMQDQHACFFHEFRYVTDWGVSPVARTDLDLLFIDSKPNRSRMQLLERLDAKVIVVHNADSPAMGLKQKEGYLVHTRNNTMVMERMDTPKTVLS